MTADGRTSITVERCGLCNTTIAFETGPDGTSEWTLDDSDYGRKAVSTSGRKPMMFGLSGKKEGKATEGES